MYLQLVDNNCSWNLTSKFLVAVLFNHMFGFQISSSTTDKYMFMYISKANQILAESQKFYISDVDPESDLDLICVEDNEDLEDFTLIQSTPEREQGDATQNLQLKLFIFAKFHRVFNSINCNCLLIF